MALLSAMLGSKVSHRSRAMVEEMEKKNVIALVFAIAIALAVTVPFSFAQLQLVNDCPDKCENNSLYTDGYYDGRDCIYRSISECVYGCRVDKPVCNSLPSDEVQAREKIYDSVENIYDNVKIEISTGGTLYYVGENSSVFAKVTEGGVAVNDGFCDAIIFNSTMDEVNGYELSYINGSRGIYSANRPVSNITGLYIVDVECFKPFNSTTVTRYFRRLNMTNLLLNYTTSVTNATSSIVVPAGTEVCLNDRWTGNGVDYRYINNITNINGWFSTNSPSGSTLAITYKFYKVSSGTVYIGSSQAIASIDNTVENISFPDTGIGFPFTSDSRIQVQICYRFITGSTNPNVTFWFNSDYYNSSFDINALRYSQPIDFVVGGSSELNVKLSPYDEVFLWGDPTETLISNHDYCINNMTLGKTLTSEICLNNVCKEKVENKTIVCDFGCINETGQKPMCRPSNLEGSILLIAITFLLLIIFMSLYMVGKTKIGKTNFEMIGSFFSVAFFVVMVIFIQSSSFLFSVTHAYVLWAYTLVMTAIMFYFSFSFSEEKRYG